MGADMMVTMHRIPEITGYCNDELAAAYRTAIAATSDRHKVIAATSMGPLLEWPSEIGLPFDADFGPEDVSDAVIDELAARPEVMAFINQRLDTAVDEVISRETTVLRLFGIDVAVTGGMSWGDSPTESFTSNDLLGLLPAFEVPLEAPSNSTG